MTVTTQIKTPAEAAVTDRRRPGRIDHVNPDLIPLLRAGELPSSLDASFDIDQLDQLDQIAGVRGVFFGVAISAPMWVGIAYLGRWLFA